MKITIYVKDNHLDTLHKFLNDDVNEVRGPIEWHHVKDWGEGRYFMVTIDYNDFLKLDDR